MTTNPHHARLAFLSFLVIGAGIVGNVLYLQDRTVASQAERAKIERSHARAQAERNRRLAVAPNAPIERLDKLVEGKPQAAMVRPVAPSEQPPTTRVGRFAMPAAPKPDKPERSAAQPVEIEAERSQDTIRAVQQRLQALGYEPGPANGVTGLLTRGAIMAYEHDQGLPLSGEPSDTLLRHVENAPGARDAAARPSRGGRAPHAEQVLRTVQQSLASLGYFAAKIDGRLGEDTERAIREYEMDHGLVPTGRVSAPLLVRLARSASTSKPSAAPKTPVR